MVPPAACACPTASGSPADRAGLSIADATSAVFAQDIPWDKVDVLTFSWQKVLGGEGAHGVLILGPRAVERLESYTPAWPLPKVFRLTSKGKLIEGIFTRRDDQHAVHAGGGGCDLGAEWARDIGGLAEMKRRADANAAALDRIVQERDWLGHLAADPAIRSNTSVCLTVEGADTDFIKRFAGLLEQHDAAYDIASYRDAPPGLRIWCGATVDTATSTRWRRGWIGPGQACAPDPLALSLSKHLSATTTLQQAQGERLSGLRLI
jgi:phosphoserine aminotransferase